MDSDLTERSQLRLSENLRSPLVISYHSEGEALPHAESTKNPTPRRLSSNFCEDVGEAPESPDITPIKRPILSTPVYLETPRSHCHSTPPSRGGLKRCEGTMPVVKTRVKLFRAESEMGDSVEAKQGVDQMVRKSIGTMTGDDLGSRCNCSKLNVKPIISILQESIDALENVRDRLGDLN